MISAAHTHTPYGTPFAAQVRLLQPISQESCSSFEDHALFDDEEVDIGSTDGGKRIGLALGENKAVILRNHGLLTVGASVDSSVGFFLQMERAAEVHVKVPDAVPISDEAARIAHDGLGGDTTGISCSSGCSARSCRILPRWGSRQPSVEGAASTRR